MSRPGLLDLGNGGSCLIDEADMGLTGALTLYKGTNGYVYFSTWANGKSNPRTLHGLLMDPPSGTHVDHINGDKLDNRRENLRIVTPQINQVNRKRLNRNNTSGVRGVHRNVYGSWVAQIMAHRKQRYLGSFATREQAIAVRRAAELDLFGEFCP